MISLQRPVLLLAIAGLLIATTLLVTHAPHAERAKDLAKQYFPGYSTSTSLETKRLHLLVPATDSNLEFCRFLLTSTIAGYPDPILIGWKSHGEYDGKKSHLFKITEGLAYLKSLPPEQEDDLVLMVDAYDIWMLLRPEVMITRYNRVIAEQTAQLKEEGILGTLNRDIPVRNTLLWGADKICWPRANFDPSCWSVPDSPMRLQVYGPDTDSWMVPNRPRWLNSGTLIGPAGHMREMFDAALENMHRTFDADFERRDSDQYYFQDVWAEQEMTRIRLQNGTLESPVVDHSDDGTAILGYIPEIPEERRTEYRIGLDWGVELFQTAAGFTEYLTWMSFNNTSPLSSGYADGRRRIDQLPLPEEVLKSRPPFETKFPTEGLPVQRSWRDVVLGVNLVQQTVWPLLHVTGNKEVREKWWHYYWAHPHAEALIKDAAKPSGGGEPEVLAVVDGVRYIAADTSRMKGVTSSGGRGGGWSDVGDRFEWEGLCGEWETDPGLYLK